MTPKFFGAIMNISRRRLLVWLFAAIVHLILYSSHLVGGLSDRKSLTSIWNISRHRSGKKWCGDCFVYAIIALHLTRRQFV